MHVLYAWLLSLHLSDAASLMQYQMYTFKNRETAVLHRCRMLLGSFWLEKEQKCNYAFFQNNFAQNFCETFFDLPKTNPPSLDRLNQSVYGLFRVGTSDITSVKIQFRWGIIHVETPDMKLMFERFQLSCDALHDLYMFCHMIPPSVCHVMV